MDNIGIVSFFENQKTNTLLMLPCHHLDFIGVDTNNKHCTITLMPWLNSETDRLVPTKERYKNLGVVFQYILI